MNLIRQAFNEFPEWFTKNKWKNVRIEHPFMTNPDWENDFLIFDFSLFNNIYRVRIMLSLERFDRCYRRCYEDKEKTFWLMSEKITNEFWTELQRYVDQQLRGRKYE